MKVGIDHTIEVTDEQRVKLADVLDGKQSRREGTRAEFKEYIWTYGKTWAETLEEEWDNIFTGEAEGSDEDLIGEPGAEEDDQVDLADLL
jgi:hypothetical protein